MSEAVTSNPRRYTDQPALDAYAAIKSKFPDAETEKLLPDVHPLRIPAHVAVIMDGNGRWASERGFPRIFGHKNGTASVRTAIETCSKIGIGVLTLYSFSSENWSRPSDEVEALMELCIAYCDGERAHFVDKNIRVRILGRREGMPEEVLKALDRLQEATAGCTGLTLCLAVNYGSRDEIVDAVREIARRINAGELSPEDITDTHISDSLYTAGLPDPDMLIRTGGDLRVSNYLLWQISYTELYVTDLYWPDFGVEQWLEAVRNFASRNRRFGGLGTAQDGDQSG